jgi:hypothetical protein
MTQVFSLSLRYLPLRTLTTVDERVAAGRTGPPRRHRMRKAARRESAKAWLTSGAQVTVKRYAKRYGVDCYSAREDLEAIGFVFAPADTRWSVRPKPVPRVAKADEDTGQDPRMGWIGDRLMLVVGYTPGGAPYGCCADEMEDPF